MAFFFSSAFTKGKQGPKPETIAVKNARIFLNKEKAKNYGVIADPKIYDEVISKYLAPYEDDLTVQQFITQLQSDGAKLAEKANDEEFKVTTLQNNLNEQQLALGKEFKDSPGDIILQTTQLYDQAIRKLRQEAEINRQSNGAYSKLENEAKKLESVSFKLNNLAGAVIAGTDNPEMTGDFGFYIDSDPTTGKIISMTLNPTGVSPKGYLRTDSFYGNTPVYAKGTRNPYAENKLTAKIGSQTYSAESQQTETEDTASGNLNQTILKLQKPKDISGQMTRGDKFKNVFRTGDSQKKFDVSKGAFDISLGDTDFIQNSYNDLPNNSIARDTNRNIWLKNNEGRWTKFDSLDTLSQVMGEPKDKLETQVKDITNADTKAFTGYELFNNSMLQSPNQNGSAANTSTPVSARGSAPEVQVQSGPPTPGISPSTTPPAQKKPAGAELQQKNLKNILTGVNVAGGSSALQKILNPFSK